MIRPVDNRTVEKRQADFVAELTRKCSVYHAAKVAGVSRTTVYTWRRQDEAFAHAWDDALEDALDILEQSLYQRAKSGKDTTAAIFILKGRRSKIYMDRSEVAQTQVIKTVDADAWDAV